MPQVKMLGFVSGVDSYVGKEGTVENVSVACGTSTYNCRGTAVDGLEELDRVVIIGTLQMHSKGSFFKHEVCRRATADEIAELKAGV